VLGFGKTQDQAVNVAQASVDHSFTRARDLYVGQWLRYDAGLHPPSPQIGADVVRQYYRSVNVVKASEDKMFPGAIAAGLASPWGQSVPAGNFASDGKPTYFGSYREVFARDLYEAFAGLLVAGDVSTAQDATRFLFDHQQQADGSMPRNSLLNGEVAPDTGGLQLDETSYPILMDWQSGLASDSALYHDHVIPAADFVVAHGPSDGVERWEEQSGYSPSTIAAEIAGLTAASAIATVHGDVLHAALYQATADEFARQIKVWTVTTSGPYAPRYFIRVAKTGDPNAAISYGLGNGSITADQRSVVDAGFLELVRLGILPATDPDVSASLPVVDQVIEHSTPNGPGFYRYGTSASGSEDGYGDCFQPGQTSCPVLGAPWAPTGTGTGHLWPVLAGERGEYDVARGDSSGASTLLGALAAMTSGRYLEPEQAWEDPALPAAPFGSDPTTASIGFEPGQPAGSASPLTWAQSQFARLALNIGAGHNLETPDIVSDRYVAHGMPGSLPLTITSPADKTRLSTPSVTVTGATTAGARVDAEASDVLGGAAATTTTTAAPDGSWSVSLPVGVGTTTITVSSTLGNSTGYAQVSVINVTLPGDKVLDVSDPTGDDNGPGTYAYPTSGDFKPGAFDLLRMQVNETATEVYIQFTIANLTPTFGNTFGAQLLDLYVRDNPAVGSTSTAAASTLRNYTIAPVDAWTQFLEAQGFAELVWTDANGNPRGTGQFVADTLSGTATLILPRSVFGSVGSGWVFTVALTGQDGFSPDQSRGFAPTPQPFQFGVCATAGNPNPICSVSPDAVPRVMDTITPPGVDQGAELNPTLGPVVLQGVVVP
jgi:glucoamylase